MKRLIIILILLIFAVRITTLETKYNELEKKYTDTKNTTDKRMQDYEHYIDYLKNSIEPFVIDNFEKSVRERL